MNSSTLIQKIWNFCHTLRDDRVGYGDYLEQLTYLLFLKLAHGYAQEPYHHDTRIPRGYDSPSLKSKTGQPLELHYLAILNKPISTSCRRRRCWRRRLSITWRRRWPLSGM